MAGKSHGKAKKGRLRSLVKAVAALTATALLEAAILRAVEDPRVRSKAKALGKAVQKRVRVA